jgi:hypothetical protein
MGNGRLGYEIKSVTSVVRAFPQAESLTGDSLG